MYATGMGCLSRRSHDATTALYAVTCARPSRLLHCGSPAHASCRCMPAAALAPQTAHTTQKPKNLTLCFASRRPLGKVSAEGYKLTPLQAKLPWRLATDAYRLRLMYQKACLQVDRRALVVRRAQAPQRLREHLRHSLRLVPPLAQPIQLARLQRVLRTTRMVGLAVRQARLRGACQDNTPPRVGTDLSTVCLEMQPHTQHSVTPHSPSTNETWCLATDACLPI